MTEKEARLFEDEMVFDRIEAQHWYFSEDILRFFDKKTTFTAAPKQYLYKCRLDLSKLDNESLATFIEAISINILGRGTFLRYKCATENVQEAIDDTLEGKSGSHRCTIIITRESYLSLEKELEEVDDY